MMTHMRSVIFVSGLAALSLAAVAWVRAADRQEWPVFAGDSAATHYSPLTDIDRSNVQQLGIAWEWKTGDDGVTTPAGVRPG